MKKSSQLFLMAAMALLCCIALAPLQASAAGASYQGLYIIGVMQPLTGVTMYEAVPLGPVAVTQCGASSSTCQFVKDRVDLSNRIKINDIVQ